MTREELRFYIRDNISMNDIIEDIGKVRNKLINELDVKIPDEVIKEVLTEYKYGVFII